MLDQQLAAGFIAAVLLAVGAAALVRSTTIFVLVALGLLATIPFLALVTYAIAPRPTQDLGLLVNLALVPALLALGAGSYAVATSINRAPISSSRANSLGIAYFVVWVGIVLAISLLIAVWEPGFAVANLALNAAWTCFWAVPSTRRFGAVSAVEIKAPRHVVFAFMADAANWQRYDEQLVSALADPPGPLRVGSRVTEVRRYEAPVRGPRMLPTTIEVVTEVIAFEPDELLSARDGRGLVTATTNYSDTEEGTRVQIDVKVGVPFHQAFLGTILLLRSQRAARRARAERNLAKLREILERQ